MYPLPCVIGENLDKMFAKPVIATYGPSQKRLLLTQSGPSLLLHEPRFAT